VEQEVVYLQEEKKRISIKTQTKSSHPITLVQTKLIAIVAIADE